MVGRLRQLDHAAVVGDGLVLGDQLLGRFQLADDLLRCVPGALHGGVFGLGRLWESNPTHGKMAL